MADTLASLLQAQLGAATFTATNRELSSVGATAARLLRQSPYRASFLVINLSPDTLFCGPFVDVSTTKGVRLGPNGGSLVVRWHEDFSLVSYEWFVISDGVASRLLTMEQLLLGEEAVVAIAR